MSLREFTFYSVIRRNAVCFGGNEAWVEAGDGRVATYLGFRERVARLAAGLRAAGVAKGDRIGVVGKNCLEYFQIYGAAAALGAIVLPVNWRLSPEEMRFNLEDGAPVVLFADAEFQEAILGMLGGLPSVRSCYRLDGEANGPFSDFRSLTECRDDFAPEDVSSKDGFIIIHTAAVGGRPRGALLSHENLLCSNIHVNSALGMADTDVYLGLLPFFHIGGISGTSAAFHAGASIVSTRRFDADESARLIAERRVSVTFEFAPMLSSLLAARERAAVSLGSLRAVAGLDVSETIERYQELTGGDFYCLYGQTEVSAYATLGRYNDRPGSAGKPVPLGEVGIVDRNDLPLPQGAVGEIVVRGPLVFLGYWNLPGDTESAFRNGWHHTGDLGRFDEGGFLWYAGRAATKELIKPGGENVYPAEVEKVILSHPAVLHAVVFGVPDPKWKEGIKAVCELKEGCSLRPEELIDFVGTRIARYKRPGSVEFPARLPLLADGTPDREKIKEVYGGRGESSLDIVIPRKG